MKHVIIRTYSNFHDITTGTAFEPLNLGTSSIGHAVVSDDMAETLAERTAFEILTDEEFEGLTKAGQREVLIDFSTGDVLTDQAQAKDVKTKAAATRTAPVQSPPVTSPPVTSPPVDPKAPVTTTPPPPPPPSS